MRLRILLALVPILATLAAAQTFRGGIQGTVTDPKGSVIQGAQVTVVNQETKLTRTMTTGDSGDYFFTELPIGLYDLTAKARGFRSETVKSVQVEISVTAKTDVQLKIQAGSEVGVEDTAPPLVSTVENNLGGILEASHFAELPVSGRDYTKLLVMVPGSGGDPSGVADSPGSFGLFSINGNRGRSNNYMIDGTDMNDGYRNLPAVNQGGVFGTPATILPIDAIQEISIISSTEAKYR